MQWLSKERPHLIVQEELRRKGGRYGGLDERSCESDFSDHE